MNQSFCVLPFYRTTVRSQGGMSPCCLIHNYSNITNSSVSDFWVSDKLNSLRQRMLEGQLCDECETCYRAEKISGKSMRTESLRDHAVDHNTDLSEFVSGKNYLGRSLPNHFEFHLGNLCNLKCLTCNPNDSSSFLAENKILKISSHQQSDFDIDKVLVDKIMTEVVDHGIEILDLRGGETMLIPYIRDFLNSLPHNHSIKSLRIQTNCTILDDVWKRIFSRFDNVEIMMSIDAFGTANNYIRYPSKWETIVSNVDYFASCTNTKIYINCVVSNLNLLLLEPLVNWAREKQIYFHWSLLERPTYFRFTNLPESLFNSGLEMLKRLPVFNTLSGQHDDQEWPDFCHMIGQRDKHRKNSILTVVPQFTKFWVHQ